MADFKTALIALSNGEIEYAIVASNIGKILNANPALAVEVLEQLQDAFNAGILDAETFAKFKVHVTQLSLREDPEQSIAAEARAAVANLGDLDIALDFDLSPVTENPQRAAQKSTANTDTSWPGDKPQKQRAKVQTKIESGAVLKGRFQLDEVLGVGGMGTVYRGRDLIRVEARDKNPYMALKVLNEDFKDHPDAFIALQREASRQQKLAHPNIATVYDFDRTEDGTFFLTMELLEGEPLNKFIKKTVKPRGGLPFDEAFPMIEGLAHALIYAHERDIVHSDLKPGNCFITKDGTMKVLDFGIARAVKTPGQADGEKTIFDPGKLGALTPPYASVEMLEEKEPDTRDDIYALACVAYELLTGKHPFNKLRATAARDNNLIPAPIKNLKKSQIKALHKGLGFSREERSQTVSEFIEELRGKRSAFSNPWLTVPSVAVILIAIGIFPLIGTLNEREMARHIDALKSNDLQRIENTLATVNAPDYDADMRDRILVASRKEILNHFDIRIAEKVNVPENKLDFRGARELIKKLSAFQVFSDSAQVAQWNRVVDEAESDILNRQSAAFNEALIFDRLLDLDDENDVHDVLKVVANLSPEMANTFTIRLPGAYAAAIERAIVNNEFVRAVSLSQAGLKFLPDDPYLTNLADKIAGEQEKSQFDASIAEAEAAIRDTLAVGSRLEDFVSLQEEIHKLAFFSPENSALRQLRDAIKEQSQSLLAEPNEPVPRGDVAANQTHLSRASIEVLRSLGLADIASRHERLLDNSDQQVEGLVAQLKAAILEPTMTIQSPAITETIAAIGKFPLDSLTAREAFEMTARWALANARRARSLGNLELALQNLDQLSELVGNRIPMPYITDEKQIILALENNNAVHYVQNSQEQKTQFQDLSSAFLVLIETLPTSQEQFSAIVNAFDAVAATDPASPRLMHFRTLFAEKMLAAHDALVADENHDLALTLLRQFAVHFPVEKQVSKILEQLQDKKLAARKRGDGSQVGVLLAEIDSLLAEKVADRHWNQNIQRLLIDLQRTATDDNAAILEKRQEIAERLMKEAKRAQSEGRYAQAEMYLWRARPYSPNSQQLDALERQLTQANLEFVLKQRARERDARVVGLQRDFKTQIQANDIVQAANSYVALKRETSPDDQFSSSEAPALLAQAYLNVARRAAAKDDYTTALDITKSGAQLLPTDISLRQATREFSVRGNSQALLRIFARGGDFDLSDTLNRIAEIKQLDLTYYEENEMAWAVAIAERIRQSKINADPEISNHIEKAQSIFNGITVIQQINDPVVTAELHSSAATEIQAALNEGLLGKARRLLADVDDDMLTDPEIIALQQTKDELVEKSRQNFNEYKHALAQNDLTLADQKIQAALAIWKDNTMFVEESKRLAGSTIDKPKNGNVLDVGYDGKTCMHRLAGQGKRLNGTCYDMISASTRGPLLVVIPAPEGDRAAFAFGKYEITVGDFNTFCRDSAACEKSIEGDNSMPVRNISHEAATQYIAWLNEKTSGNYRLPSPDEWRYAAAAENDEQRQDINCRVIQDNSIVIGQDVTQIDNGKANSWGIYNYLGNVQEWAVAGNALFALGGSYQDPVDACNIATQKSHLGTPDNATGFRVLKQLD